MMEVRDEDGNRIGGSEEMQVDVDLFRTATNEAGPLSPSTSTSSSGTFISFGHSRSKVWDEFVVAADGKKVVCRLCGDSLWCLSNSHSDSTSSMLKHLKRKHEMDLYPSTEVDGKASVPVGTRAMEKPKKNNEVKRVTTFTNQNSVEPEQAIQHDPLVFTEQCVRMKWADSSTVFKGAFARLYAEESYTDVTLVAEKIFFKAHRVVLSAASDYFDQIFKMTPSGQHPVIFLKDIKAMDLRLLLEFVYKGEVSLPPRLVDGLVRVGTELKIRGLSGFQRNEAFKNDVIHYQQAGNNVSLQVMSSPSQNRQEQDEHLDLPEQQAPPSPPVMTPTPASSISIPAALQNAVLSNNNTSNNNDASVTADTPVPPSTGVDTAPEVDKVVSPARNFVVQTLKQSLGVVPHPTTVAKSKYRTTFQHSSAMGSSTPLQNSLPRTFNASQDCSPALPVQRTNKRIPFRYRKTSTPNRLNVEDSEDEDVNSTFFMRNCDDVFDGFSMEIADGISPIQKAKLATRNVEITNALKEPQNNLLSVVERQHFRRATTEVSESSEESDADSLDIFGHFEVSSVPKTNAESVSTSLFSTTEGKSGFQDIFASTVETTEERQDELNPSYEVCTRNPTPYWYTSDEDKSTREEDRQKKLHGAAKKLVFDDWSTASSSSILTTSASGVSVEELSESCSTISYRNMSNDTNNNNNESDCLSLKDETVIQNWNDNAATVVKATLHSTESMPASKCNINKRKVLNRMSSITRPNASPPPCPPPRPPPRRHRETDNKILVVIPKSGVLM